MTLPRMIEFPAGSGDHYALTNVDMTGPELREYDMALKIVAKLTSANLVSLHNLAAANLGMNRVNRFSDLSTGQKRTWKVLELYEAEVRAAHQKAAAQIEAAKKASEEHARQIAQAEAASAPSANPGKKERQPKKARPALRQDDGSYVFDMPPRAGGRFKTVGGRRPELMDLLRKSPNFRQLMAQYQPRGNSDDERTFNMATTITCMCHVVGCGVRTEGGTSSGRIIFSEAL